LGGALYVSLLEFAPDVLLTDALLRHPAQFTVDEQGFIHDKMGILPSTKAS
jgi:hypothetical protein